MAVRSGLLLTALIVCLAGAAPARAAACSAMRWTTLGTAGGPVPTADRAEPSNLLVAGDQQIHAAHPHRLHQPSSSGS